tara:strand:- start:178 stop:375 length:198 start_codon:yes stop_codon:yes gene_type:complete
MDPESKLFYRKLLDFGPGVGFKEGQRKFEEEMRIEDEVRSNLNQDVATNPTTEKFLKLFMQDRFA